MDNAQSTTVLSATKIVVDDGNIFHQFLNGMLMYAFTCQEIANVYKKPKQMRFKPLTIGSIAILDINFW